MANDSARSQHGTAWTMPAIYLFNRVLLHMPNGRIQIIRNHMPVVGKALFLILATLTSFFGGRNISAARSNPT
jgi:hypothetical protein